ncbi:AzlD domain-containing protein [Pseudaquabacterium rugosum]|jgi:branched-subunit amino acid transport protein|uniref:AzlD domain-containing protein n=1 Tax=Pseudaquabacterium rugosum TaxID=2984194 RepID=A0ABU9BFP6_9BURK
MSAAALSWGDAQAAWGVVGLALVTVFTRAVFLLPRRTPRLPGWLWRGLSYAPLAALAALIAPELQPAAGLAAWADPRFWSVAAALLAYAWRRDVISPTLAGTAVLLLSAALR